MLRIRTSEIGLGLLGVSLLVVGCQDRPAPAPEAKAPDAKAAKPADAKETANKEDHDHDHPSKGPHGGDLIELGDEEYHAELTHDDKTHEVTIYLLDGAAKSAVAIEAKELVINLKDGGKPEQHKLAAAPLESDGAGKSSRFVAKGNADLNDDLEHDDADARLQVTIAGQSYIGKIVHDHDHDDADPKEHKDHDHDHDHKAEKTKK